MIDGIDDVLQTSGSSTSRAMYRYWSLYTLASHSSRCSCREPSMISHDESASPVPVEARDEEVTWHLFEGAPPPFGAERACVDERADELCTATDTSPSYRRSRFLLHALDAPCEVAT
jgi:hypothetical protein